MIGMASTGCQGQDPKISRNRKHPTFIRLHILLNSIILTYFFQFLHAYPNRILLTPF